MFSLWNIGGVANSEELWTRDPDRDEAYYAVVGNPDGTRATRTTPGFARLSRLNDQGEREVVNDTTHVMLWAMISTGFEELTENNWQRFFSTMRMLELAGGALRTSPDGEEILIEPAEVLRLIGLKVPASGMRVSNDHLLHLLSTRAQEALTKFET